MYVICSEERFVEISSPNECDKILKIPNEQTEPTDYMANCSTDSRTLIKMVLYISKSTEDQRVLQPIRFWPEALCTVAHISDNSFCV